MARRKEVTDALKAEVGIHVVTPNDAKGFLVANTGNYRNLSDHKVKKYAEDMRAGDWPLTSNGIAFNGDGRLIDGQHRLHACVLANVSFPTIILRYAPEGAEVATDTGMKRTFGHLLRSKEVKDANNVATLVRYVWAFDKGTLTHGGQAQMTSHQGLEKYNTDPEGFYEANLQGRRLKTHVGLRATAGAAAFYLTARKGGDASNDAYAFVDQMVEGTNLDPGSPVLALQKWTRSTLRRVHVPNTTYQLAIVLKAMNAYREGVPVTMLAWKRGGDKPEPLPTVWEDPSA